MSNDGPRFRCLLAGTMALITAVSASTANAASGAGISGSAVTAANTPLRASLTLHDLSTPRIPGQTPFDRQFASKPDGTFSLTEVPAGKYEICVDAPQENVLDPCIWSTPNVAGPTVITVSGDAPVTGIAVTVDTGFTLKVHVNDPEGLLPTPPGGVIGEALSLGLITGTNRYVNLRALGPDSPGSRARYVVAPFNQAFTLSVASPNLALSDGDGRRYSADAMRVPVRVAAGGTAEPVTVNVGKR